jgi:hypothetical protein
MNRKKNMRKERRRYRRNQSYRRRRSRRKIWKIIIRSSQLFLICKVGVGAQTGSTRHVGHYWPIAPAPGDCEDGEFGGMNGRGNRSTRRKPGPRPLCPPQIPLDQTRD